MKIKTCIDYNGKIIHCWACEKNMQSERKEECFIRVYASFLSSKNLKFYFKLAQFHNKTLSSLRYLEFAIQEHYPELLPKLNTMLLLK